MAPIPIPELGHEFLANEPGRCICGQRIEEGEAIRRIGAKDFGHSLCAKGYVDVLREYQTDDDAGDGVREEASDGPQW